MLLVVLSLVNVKAKYGWSDKSFTLLLKVVQDMLLEENMLPKRYYEMNTTRKYRFSIANLTSIFDKTDVNINAVA